MHRTLKIVSIFSLPLSDWYWKHYAFGWSISPAVDLCMCPCEHCIT